MKEILDRVNFKFWHHISDMWFWVPFLRLSLYRSDECMNRMEFQHIRVTFEIECMASAKENPCREKYEESNRTHECRSVIYKPCVPFLLSVLLFLPMSTTDNPFGIKGMFLPVKTSNFREWISPLGSGAPSSKNGECFPIHRWQPIN